MWATDYEQKVNYEWPNYKTSAPSNNRYYSFQTGFKNATEF